MEQSKPSPNLTDLKETLKLLALATLQDLNQSLKSLSQISLFLTTFKNMQSYSLTVPQVRKHLRSVGLLANLLNSMLNSIRRESSLASSQEEQKKKKEEGQDSLTLRSLGTLKTVQT